MSYRFICLQSTCENIEVKLNSNQHPHLTTEQDHTPSKAWKHLFHRLGILVEYCLPWQYFYIHFLALLILMVCLIPFPLSHGFFLGPIFTFCFILLEYVLWIILSKVWYIWILISLSLFCHIFYSQIIVYFITWDVQLITIKIVSRVTMSTMNLLVFS